jgi:hypothetical protein
MVVTSAPASSSLDCTSGSSSVLLISAWRRETIARGVPRGAKNPCHSAMSKSLIPLASATVGTSFATPERLAVDTASSLIVPAFTCGTVGGKPEKNMSTCPPRISFSAGAAPL